VTLKEREDKQPAPSPKAQEPEAQPEKEANENSKPDAFFKYEDTPWFRSKGTPKQKPSDKPKKADGPPRQSGDRPPRQDRPRGRGGERRDRGDKRKSRPRDRAPARGQQRRPDMQKPSREPSVPLEMPPLYHIQDEQIEPARILEFIGKCIVPTATVTTEEHGEQLWLDISAKGRGIFIGRKGATLEALQFMMNKIVGKAGGFPKKIVVDSEGYRKRRNEQLSSEARKLAERVLRGRTPLETEPMSAFDRRIVHLTLHDHEEVTTRSLGGGDLKRVQILLKTDPAADIPEESNDDDEDIEEKALDAQPDAEPEKDGGDEPDGQGL